MKQEIADKIRQSFSTMAIYKDPDKINSVFTGRNLPSFVKDFLLKGLYSVKVLHSITC